MSDELTVAFLDMMTPTFALSNLIKKYPAQPGDTSVSGRIPMSEFVANESVYRDRMRQIGLRSVYRGRREISYSSSSSGESKEYESWTRRRNAEFVVLYMNGLINMKHDKYNSALDTLYHLTNDLFGGHYEPKSERDRELAEELYEILNRHKTNPLPPDQ